MKKFLALCWTFVAVTSSNDFQLQKDDDLICRIRVEKSWTMNQVGKLVPDEHTECELVSENVESVESYEVDLPVWIKEKHFERIHRGLAYVAIPRGYVTNNLIVIPSNSDVAVLNPDDKRLQLQMPRHLQQVTGTKKLLVARVSLNDSQVGLSSTDLEDYIFGLSSSSVSVVNQFEGCSSSKLIIKPSDLGGVINIFVNNSISSYSSWRVLRNDAALALKQYVGTGQLLSLADYVMLCLPPGNWNFMTSTSTGYWRSTYDNLYCGYLSVVMHQLGSSMGLSNSNDIRPLQDTTCYMGLYTTTVGSPQKCFNAQKHWMLGWFTDRVVTVNPTNAPQSFSLASFLDYNSTESTDAVVLKVGESVYIQYNTATGFNIGTGENKNQVVVVQSQKDGVSEKLGGLDLQNPSLRVTNYTSGTDLVIETCQFNSTRLDIAIVSISLGTCSCCFSSAPSSSSTTHSPSGLNTSQAPSSSSTTHVPSSVSRTNTPSSLTTSHAPSTLSTTHAPSTLSSSNAPSTLSTTHIPSSLGNTTSRPSVNSTQGPPTTHPNILSHNMTHPPSTSPMKSSKPTVAEKPSHIPTNENSSLSPRFTTLYPTEAHAPLDSVGGQSSSAFSLQGSLMGAILVVLGILL